MTWILLLVAFISLPVQAFEPDMKNYINLQLSLAADNFTEAQVSYHELCASKIKEYDFCARKVTTIAELRDSFKLLSIKYIEKFDKNKNADLVVVECPMAKAKWIQKKGTIQNPYYGKEMLTCGYEVE